MFISISFSSVVAKNGFFDFEIADITATPLEPKFNTPLRFSLLIPPMLTIGFFDKTLYDFKPSNPKGCSRSSTLVFVEKIGEKPT